MSDHQEVAEVVQDGGPEHHEGSEALAKETPKERWERTKTAIEERGKEFARLLPAHISPDRFKATAITAIQQNLDLLNATPRSLMQAISKAALDGILPDGREGIITVYNVKGVPTAQWNPMAGGLRKRLRELDDIIADCQVVYRNDLFKRVQGDDPKLIHEPVQPWEDAGPAVACYAIFRKDGVILHREIMNAQQVETTRKQSKQPDSLMWKTFPEEGWKKVVMRRGIKTVPVTESMAAIIKRDDETNFDFAETPHVVAALTPPPAPPPAQIEQQQTPVLPATTTKPEAEKTPRRKKGENRGPAKAADAPQPEPQGPQANGPDPNDPRFKTADEWKAETDATATAGDSEDPRVEGIETAGILADEWQEYFDMMEGEVKGARDATQEAQTHEAVTDHIQSNLERGKIDRALHERLNDEWARRTGSKA